MGLQILCCQAVPSGVSVKDPGGDLDRAYLIPRIADNFYDQAVRDISL
jgi:hypothetical protein